MATDYLTRMYWPKRGSEAAGENFTTYGRTIALSAKLSAADRRAVTMDDYRARNNAFMQMIARQRQLEEQQENAQSIMYNGGQRCSTSHEVRRSPGKNFHQTNRSKTFMSPHNSHVGHSVTSMPLDIAVYNAPSNDPFVPNNSYKEYASKRNRSQSRQLPTLIDSGYEGMLPVHRLYRSAGGYDDTIKAANHIKHYRPAIQDISEYKVRQGRNGGAWRHVKEVMQGKGERILFVDGITSIDDLARIKTNMMRGGVKTPKSAMLPRKDNYTAYVTPSEMQASEGVNWNVMR